MRNSVALLLVSVTLALATPVKAQQPPPPPYIALVVPHSAGAPEPAVREVIAAALRGRGAVLAPDHDVHAAARGLSRPVVELTDPPVARDLCRALNLTAVVDVSLERASAGAPEPYVARVTVVGPDGAVRLRSLVSVRTPLPSPDEARATAAIAMQGLSLPPPVVVSRDRAGEPNADAESISSAPTSSWPEPPVFPPPEPLRMTMLSAAPTITFRDLVIKSPTPSGADFNYKIGAPYYGVALGAKFFPFAGRISRYFGFDLTYAFSAAAVTTTVTNLAPSSLLATQDRLEADLLGRIPGHPGGGDLTLYLGFGFEGFFVQTPPPLVTSVYLGPRLLAEYSHPLPFHLAFDLKAGIRPIAYAGSALSSAFGLTRYAYGLEGAGEVSGPFAQTMLPNLRWVVGYDILYYGSQFGHPNKTTQQEAYNRITLGVKYEF